MQKALNDVAEFHRLGGLPIAKKPGLDGDEGRRLRRRLLHEEYEEYIRAEGEDNLVGIADALADMVYIICGTALEYGIPLGKVWEEVHHSNMQKVRGKIRFRKDRKIIKPRGWKPPDIESILNTVEQRTPLDTTSEDQ